MLDSSVRELLFSSGTVGVAVVAAVTGEKYPTCPKGDPTANMARVIGA